MDYITQADKDKIENELNTRMKQRKELSDRIGRARELGDLKENGEYHAAREDQGMNEARIKQLEEENQALRDHLASLNANGETTASCVPASAPISTDTTPSLGPASPRTDPSASNTPILSAPVMLEDNHQQEEVSLTLASLKNSSTGRKRPLPRPDSSIDAPTQTPSPPSNDRNANNDRGITVNQIKDILHTAGELDKNSAIAGMLSISSSAASNASPVSIQNSDDEDEQHQESDDDRSPKRQCIAPSSAPVPASC